MDKKVRDRLKEYPNVLAMFEAIPEQLWDIFWPGNDREKFLLESRAIILADREGERDEVMSLQKLCKFPLRPNQPLHEVRVMAMIQGKKNDDIYRKYRKDRYDGSGPII